MIDLHARLTFFLATDALKELQRANWVHSTPRFENVAEHSWHAALLAMLFADAAPEGTDHSHVRDLLVVHDLVEVYAGDTPIWDDILRASEAEREELGGAQLMAMLPEVVFSRFDALWREFQAQETEEARFSRAIDTLHPLVMSWTEGGHGHANAGITPSLLLERKRPTIAGYTVLWELVTRIIQDAVDRGALPPDEAIQRNEVPNALDSVNSQPDLHSRLRFFLVTDKLKELERANRIHMVSRLETVAEHSWHAMLLAILFSDAARDGVDHGQVGDLLVIHDLVEVYAGDTPLWNLDLQGSEIERERKAGERLMAMLPDDVKQRFDSLWREFQAQQTAEARFTRAIDSLHPIILSWTEGGHGHPEHEFSPSWLIERKHQTISAYPDLWNLLLEILQGAVDRGLLSPDEVIQRREKPDHE